MAEEKPHKPSERKVDNARKEGGSVKSQAITAGCSIFGTVLGAVLMAHFFWRKNEMLLEYGNLLGKFTAESALRVWVNQCFISVLIPLALGALSGVAAEWMQVGSRFNLGLSLPRAKRLNPVEGAKRIGKGLKQIYIPLLKIVAWGIYLTVFFALLMEQSLSGIGVLGERRWFYCFIQLFGGAGVIFLVVGVLEYCVKRREFFKEHSMSDHEVKREVKDEEGDPQIRSARRALHQSLSFAEVRARVRKSRVILVRRREKGLHEP